MLFSHQCIVLLLCMSYLFLSLTVFDTWVQVSLNGVAGRRSAVYELYSLCTPSLICWRCLKSGWRACSGWLTAWVRCWLRRTSAATCCACWVSAMWLRAVRRVRSQDYRAMTTRPACCSVSPLSSVSDLPIISTQQQLIIINVYKLEETPCSFLCAYF